MHLQQIHQPLATMQSWCIQNRHNPLTRLDLTPRVWAIVCLATTCGDDIKSAILRHHSHCLGDSWSRILEWPASGCGDPVGTEWSFFGQATKRMIGPSVHPFPARQPLLGVTITMSHATISIHFIYALLLFLMDSIFLPIVDHYTAPMLTACQGLQRSFMAGLGNLQAPSRTLDIILKQHEAALYGLAHAETHSQASNTFGSRDDDL